MGTHSELIAMNGIYKNLYDIQFNENMQYKKNSSLLTKFLNDEKLTFATNSANLPTSWLQTS